MNVSTKNIMLYTAALIIYYVKCQRVEKYVHHNAAKDENNLAFSLADQDWTSCLSFHFTSLCILPSFSPFQWHQVCRHSCGRFCPLLTWSALLSNLLYKEPPAGSGCRIGGRKRNKYMYIGMSVSKQTTGTNTEKVRKKDNMCRAHWVIHTKRGMWEWV